MYLPNRFKMEDENEILDLIHGNPLATILTVKDNVPFVSHLPLIVEKNEKGFLLVGHLARANPHSKLLDGAEVTAIFHGPDSYITPSWYEKHDVPTWNYAVVHVQGKARTISDYQKLMEALKKLSNQMESTSKVPWEFSLPEDLDSPEILTKAIIGLEIEVREFHAKFKLGQSLNEADKQGTIKGLESDRTDEASHKVAQMMRRICLT